MALARGMAPGGGGAGGMGGAGMAAGIAMAGAALYSATQGDISKPRTSKKSKWNYVRDSWSKTKTRTFVHTSSGSKYSS